MFYVAGVMYHFFPHTINQAGAIFLRGEPHETQLIIRRAKKVQHIFTIEDYTLP